MGPVSTTLLLAALGCAALVAAGCGDGGDAPPRVVFDRSTAGCVDGDLERQRHGTECLCCHGSEFTVAGSIAADSRPVRTVIVEDSQGGSAVMSPNPFGNFFRHSPLVPPLRATIVGEDGKVATMPFLAPDAACNRCHRLGGEASMLHAP